MLFLHLKNSIVLLILGFVIGFSTPLLFKSCDQTIPEKKETIVPAKDLKKESEQLEAKYQDKINDLQNRNNELEQQLASTKSQLTEIKQKAFLTETKIKKLTEPIGYSAKELLQKVHSPDSIPTNNNCDSLIAEVNTYIQENHEKDSLYETQLTAMDSIVCLKDSIISLHATMGDSLHQVLTQALDQQEILQRENVQLKKKFKRQKFKNKLVTIGLMFLSGAAANYLLHH